jgi:phage gpG-like protein
VPQARGSAVRVEGLRELRRDLKAIKPEVHKELRDVNKDAAELVAAEARATAKRGKTGRYGGGFKAGSSGDKAMVRNRVPYANVQHWGGSIRPRGVRIYIKGDRVAEKAGVKHADQVLERLADGIDGVLHRHGFK